MTEYDNILLFGNAIGVILIAVGSTVLQGLATKIIPYGAALCVFTVLIYIMLEN